MPPLVTKFPHPRSPIAGPKEPLPLSLLNDFLYCPRRAALKVVEGWREANAHTDRGDIVHEHSDLAGYECKSQNAECKITLWRALPVWSERLGLNGKCDIVEAMEAGSRRRDGGGRRTDAGYQLPEGGYRDPDAGGGRADGGEERRGAEGPTVNEMSLLPVEFKLGKRRRWDNDDAQLCAQALCLEEMFGVPVPRGAVFHADSKRRREVEFTAELRALTEAAIAGLHALLGNAEGSATADQRSTSNRQAPSLPPAQYKPACQECSLYDICLPRATAGDGRPERLARQLFETS